MIAAVLCLSEVVDWTLMPLLHFALHTALESESMWQAVVHLHRS